MSPVTTAIWAVRSITCNDYTGTSIKINVFLNYSTTTVVYYGTTMSYTTVLSYCCGWVWGRGVSREPNLTSVFLTLLPTKMLISPYKPHIKYMRDGRCSPMISKSSMVHSHHSWCLQWEEQVVSVSRELLHCPQGNGTCYTCIIYPGSSVNWDCLYWDLQYSASGVQDLLAIPRDIDPSVLNLPTQSPTCGRTMIIMFN